MMKIYIFNYGSGDNQNLINTIINQDVLRSNFEK